MIRKEHIKIIFISALKNFRIINFIFNFYMIVAPYQTAYEMDYVKFSNQSPEFCFKVLLFVYACILVFLSSFGTQIVVSPIFVSNALHKNL